MEPFLQEPPVLGSAWEDDESLRMVVRHHLGAELFEQADRELTPLGRLFTSEETLDLGRRAEQEPPELIHFDAWGRRVDDIRVSDSYVELGRMGLRAGVTAIPYERSAYGDKARVVWAAVLAMWGPSSALYSCPMAMTDAAARTLLLYGGPEELGTVERLTSREPAEAWTSGQWMTETTGGSDVGRSQTSAYQEDGIWRLRGTKWFTSATTSEMALTLARPTGAPEGSKGLALFKVLRRLEDGNPNAIEVRRLKDKLGTRAMPTAELDLRGAIAHPVGDPHAGGGLRKIATMLNLTRLHNALGSVGSLGRGLAWARAFAGVREVFGSRLADQPLHRTTLQALSDDHMAALALTFYLAELTGRDEAGTLDGDDAALLRGLTPVAKLTTARWAVAGAAEAMEALGGVGYCEDSGLPALVRNAHVLPIWEGTTNVLSLDLLRAEQRSGSISALLSQVRRSAEAVGSLAPKLSDGLSEAAAELEVMTKRVLQEDGVEEARRLAMGIGSSLACARAAEIGAAGFDLARGVAVRLMTRGLVPREMSHPPDVWLGQLEAAPLSEGPGRGE